MRKTTHPPPTRLGNTNEWNFFRGEIEQRNARANEKAPINGSRSDSLCTFESRSEQTCRSNLGKTVCELCGRPCEQPQSRVASASQSPMTPLTLKYPRTVARTVQLELISSTHYLASLFLFSDKLM